MRRTRLVTLALAPFPTYPGPGKLVILQRVDSNTWCALKEALMSQFTSPLDQVGIAAPCKADWDSMFGNERVRFCGRCNLNVYNLSEMTKSDAELLVARTEGRLCVRFYRRTDGSILTRNCPEGLRALKRRLSRVASAVGTALVSFLAGLGFHGIVERASRPHVMGTFIAGPLKTRTPHMMGDVALPNTSVPPVVAITQGRMELIQKLQHPRQRSR